MCEFSAYVAFDKATNGQTDVKHEMWKTLSSMSLSTAAQRISGKLLPFEDLRCKAPSLANIEFGNQEN